MLLLMYDSNSKIYTFMTKHNNDYPIFYMTSDKLNINNIIEKFKEIEGILIFQ